MLKSQFIKDILVLLLNGNEVGEEIKKQLDFISETEYEYTGVGPVSHSIYMKLF